ASRSRASGAPRTPQTIHCRALPLRCSNRFPILFDCELGRHQICSSVSRSRQRSIFGRKSSLRWYRERAMKVAPISLMIAAQLLLFHFESFRAFVFGFSPSGTRLFVGLSLC